MKFLMRKYILGRDIPPKNICSVARQLTQGILKGGVSLYCFANKNKN
jgi:hypothetical protein